MFVSWSIFRDHNWQDYEAQDINLVVSFFETVISVMQKELTSSEIADFSSIRSTIKTCRDLRHGYVKQRRSAGLNGKKLGDSWSKTVHDYTYKPPKRLCDQSDVDRPTKRCRTRDKPSFT